MTETAAPEDSSVHAFPRPQGHNVPERIFEHDQVVTGEAVALRIQPASPIQLLLAGGIDFLVTVALALSTLTLLVTLGNADMNMAGTYLIIATALAVFILPAVVETATGGRSLGKWTLGVQIVRDDGGAIRFRHAIVRSLVAMFEIYMTIGSIAFISTVANPRHKRLGDLLAGTYPISLNIGEQLPPPLIMPPELAAWASQVDITRLPSPLAWRARQFLNTTTQLDARHREALGRSLAESVRPFVNPPPPPHTHPERLLAAALVIRRDTEFANNRRTEQAIKARRRSRLPYGLS